MTAVATTPTDQTDESTSAESPWKSWGDVLTLLGTADAAVTGAQTVSLHMAASWAEDFSEQTDFDPVDVTAKFHTDNKTAKLTKVALLSLTRLLPMHKDVLVDIPSTLVQPVLNYWLSTIPGPKGPRFTLSADSTVATCLARSAGMIPLSSVELAEHVGKEIVGQGLVSSVEDLVWSDNCVYGPDHVVARLMVPTLTVSIAGTTYTGGVQITTSPSGETPTALNMYAEDSTGRGIVVAGFEGKYSSRKHGQHLDAFMEWVDLSLSSVLVDLPDELEKISDLTDIEIPDDELASTVHDLLVLTKLPVAVRALVLDDIEHEDVGDGYDLLNVMLRVQEDSDEPPVVREKIMRAAGRVRSVLGDRCDTCHSLTH